MGQLTDFAFVWTLDEATPLARPAVDGRHIVVRDKYHSHLPSPPPTTTFIAPFPPTNPLLYLWRCMHCFGASKGGRPPAATVCVCVCVRSHAPAWCVGCMGDGAAQTLGATADGPTLRVHAFVPEGVPPLLATLRLPAAFNGAESTVAVCEGVIVVGSPRTTTTFPDDGAIGGWRRWGSRPRLTELPFCPVWPAPHRAGVKTAGPRGLERARPPSHTHAHSLTHVTSRLCPVCVRAVVYVRAADRWDSADSSSAQLIVAPDPSPRAAFGVAVSCGGGHVFASGGRPNGGLAGGGSVSVLRRHPTGSWRVVQTLGGGPAAGAFVGAALRACGSGTLLVGAPLLTDSCAPGTSFAPQSLSTLANATGSATVWQHVPLTAGLEAGADALVAPSLVQLAAGVGVSTVPACGLGPTLDGAPGTVAAAVGPVPPELLRLAGTALNVSLSVCDGGSGPGLAAVLRAGGVLLHTFATALGVQEVSVPLPAAAGALVVRHMMCSCARVLVCLCARVQGCGGAGVRGCPCLWTPSWFVDAHARNRGSLLCVCAG